MKPFRWSTAKNAQLRRERAISFELVVVAIEAGGLLDILDHPNPDRYPSQRIFVVFWGRYAYLLPFIEQDDHYFLKTVIPSRKATRSYLGRGEADVEA